MEVLDLAGTVVTLDALHTQRSTARQIVAAGGHYVLTVKNNTPTLRSEIEKLPWKGMPTTRATICGHGRRSTRSIRVLQAPGWIDFPGVTQVAQQRRTVTRKGKTSWENTYLITSASAREAQPAVLADWILGHWGIENRLHWVRDVTFDEDRSQIRTGSSPRVMASMRNLAISIHRLAGATNIAKAHPPPRQEPRTDPHSTADQLTKDFADALPQQFRGHVSRCCCNWARSPTGDQACSTPTCSSVPHGSSNRRVAPS